MTNNMIKQTKEEAAAYIPLRGRHSRKFEEGYDNDGSGWWIRGIA